MNDTGTLLAIVSTLISSVALIGVAASLLLQLRQLRASHAQTLRLMHAELIKLIIENPEFAVPADETAGHAPQTAREGAYVNYQFSLYRLSFNTGFLNETALRLELRSQFAIESRRAWWTRSRDIYRVETVDRRDRRFVAIVEEEFQRAAARFEAVDPA